LERNEEVKALIDQYTTPTHAKLLSEAISEIIERKLTGIFHVVGEKMSRYEFALKLAETLGLNAELIKKSSCITYLSHDIKHLLIFIIITNNGKQGRRKTNLVIETDLLYAFIKKR